MKLGRDTGSFTNYAMARYSKSFDDLEIGMGATLYAWTDRYAGTVVEIDKAKKLVTVQKDNAKRTDDRGMSDAQDYEYSANENGRTWTYRFRNGEYELVRWNTETGRWNKVSGDAVSFGFRNAYHDFSF